MLGLPTDHTCEACGEEFSSIQAFMQHVDGEHAGPNRARENQAA